MCVPGHDGGLAGGGVRGLDEGPAHHGEVAVEPRVPNPAPVAHHAHLMGNTGGGREVRRVGERAQAKKTHT